VPLQIGFLVESGPATAVKRHRNVRKQKSLLSVSLSQSSLEMTRSDSSHSWDSAEGDTCSELSSPRSSMNLDDQQCSQEGWAVDAMGLDIPYTKWVVPASSHCFVTNPNLQAHLEQPLTANWLSPRESCWPGYPAFCFLPPCDELVVAAIIA